MGYMKLKSDYLIEYKNEIGLLSEGGITPKSSEKNWQSHQHTEKVESNFQSLNFKVLE